MSAGPIALSIVIAASESAEAAHRSMRSIEVSERHDVEVLIVAALDRIQPPEWVPEGVRWIVARRASGVATLRRIGLDHARGHVVAFTEDSCTLSTGWADGWLTTFEKSKHQTATGSVLPLIGGDPVDWAVFFFEYACFLPDHRPKAQLRLAGNNFAIRRSLSARLDPEQIHETEVNGIDPANTGRSPSMAYHVRHYGLAEALRDRLRFGFQYGQRRSKGTSRGLRSLAIGLGPAILLVQLARLVVTVVSRRRFLSEFLETLPMTLGLLTAWSVGEWSGWISGMRPLRLPFANDVKQGADAASDTLARARRYQAVVESRGSSFHWPEMSEVTLGKRRDGDPAALKRRSA